MAGDERMAVDLVGGDAVSLRLRWATRSLEWTRGSLVRRAATGRDGGYAEQAPGRRRCDEGRQKRRRGEKGRVKEAGQGGCQVRGGLGGFGISSLGRDYWPQPRLAAAEAYDD